MRRRDAGYRQMKRTLASGRAGSAMLVQHRNHNPSCAIDFDVTQLISGSASHDIDLFRWFIKEEIAEVSCAMKHSPDGEAVTILLSLRSTSCQRISICWPSTTEAWRLARRRRSRIRRLTVSPAPDMVSENVFVTSTASSAAFC